MKSKNSLKKWFAVPVLSAAMLLLPPALQAQYSPGQSKAEKRAKTLSDKMQERLPLKDSIEYNKVYALNLKYAQKMQEAIQGADGRMAKFSAAKSVQKAKNKEMKTILTKEEYEKYQQMMDEMKAAAREKFRNRSGGNGSGF